MVVVEAAAQAEAQPPVDAAEAVRTAVEKGVRCGSDRGSGGRGGSGNSCDDKGCRGAE